MHRVPGIIDAVTIPLKVGNAVKKLIAFIKVEPDKKNAIPEFKTFVKQTLLISIPEYMVPSELCIIDEFPVNTNHKIDRKELTVYYSKGLWM
ncbi:MAG: hypothetical protein ABIQ40_18110 [Bacteroidia bacterium]